jgi:hypothetical protein
VRCRNEKQGAGLPGLRQFDCGTRCHPAFVRQPLQVLGRRQRLGDLYNEADYPASLDGLFGMTWDFPSVEPPG